jgi:TolA-binding protein
MATEVKQPAAPVITEKSSADRAQQFWTKNSKWIVYGLVGLVVLLGGFFAYRNFVQVPNEQKAVEAMFKAEEYYRMDSVRLALNGDGPNTGFLKIISKYGGTKSGNLAKFYAGSSYLKLGDYNNAIKYLKDFKTSDKLVELRATGLLADALAESGKKKDAVELYKKAGTMYPEDIANSPEYLFRAGLLFQELGNNDQAVEMYNIIKEKYSTSQQGRDIDKYLARLGKY